MNKFIAWITSAVAVVLILAASPAPKAIPPIPTPWYSPSRLLVSARILPTGVGGQAYHGGGINDNGEVVCSADMGEGMRAMEWVHGRRILLPLPAGAMQSTATGIDNAGTAIGWVEFPNTTRAVAWSEGAVRLLPLLPGYTNCAADGINAAGEIVGHVYNPVPGDPWYAVPSRAVMWAAAADAPYDLGVPPGCVLSRAYGINDRGQVVGWSLTSDNRMNATLWTGGHAIDLGVLPGGHVSSATCIDNSGLIAGAADAADKRTHAVVWRSRRIVALPLPYLATYCKAFAIDNRGDVVGDVSFDRDPNQGLFEWNANSGMRVLSPIDQRWIIERTVGMNGRGQVCAVGSPATRPDPVYTPLVFVLTPLRTPTKLSHGSDDTQARPSDAVGRQLLVAPNDPQSWQMWDIGSSWGYATGSDDATYVHVLRSDGVNWKIMRLLRCDKIEDGQRYIMSFRAYGDRGQTIQAGVRLSAAPNTSIGPVQSISLAHEWRTFTWTFIASGVRGQLCDAPFLFLGARAGMIGVEDVGLWHERPKLGRPRRLRRKTAEHPRRAIG